MTGSAKQSILSLRIEMDCFVGRAPLRKRFAFVAGNDDGNDDVEVLLICPTG
jgi:hypothetical protein